MSEVPKVLFPFNGQYFTFEGFVRQVENSIAAAKIYDTGTAKPVDKQLKKHILKTIAENFRRKGE